MNDWNSIYREQGVLQREPSPRVLAAIAHFKDEGLSRVLDLGCGTGRHTELLLESGFEVYGCDSSEEALRVASNFVPGAHFGKCDMCCLAYEADFFEGIICSHVIQHGFLAEIKKACQEMLRVLRPGGVVFLITASTEHPKSLTGREIEPHTLIDTDALDGHIPHHFFTEIELRDLFCDCQIYKLEHFKGMSELDPGKPTAAWQMYARKL